MKRFFSIAFVLLLTSVSMCSEQPPNIGAKFKKTWKGNNESGLRMTSSAQIDPCVERLFDGVKYKIAYRKETYRVSYVYTDDETFHTADGLKVGDSVPVSRDTVRGEPGWQSYAPKTRDGWRPVVGYDGLHIKLKDGTIIDLTGAEGIKSGIAVILGFSRSRP